jgi:diguanylate cyclase (GGDEF)-like protein
MVVGIPFTMLVLGLKAGTVITLICIVSISFINPHIAMPLSQKALITTVMGILNQTIFFHAYYNRLVSYFTRMRASNERLYVLATRDMLTDVFNARTYYEICDNRIKFARRQSAPYAVLFIDLDHFKSVNDNYGHAAGDIVLKAVADCLSRSLRASDVLGRVGGEEFSVFLPNTDTEGALTLAESIRSNIETLMPLTGESRLKITGSIGVAGSGHEDQTMLQIQKRADQAMYHAKAAGRNRVSSLDELT